MEYKKIIFLDIDGVLNHSLYYQEKRQCDRRKELGGSPICDIDENKIKLLNDLICDTNAVFVISSTWRKFHTIEEIQGWFEELGFLGKIIDFTPVLRFQSNENERGRSVPRGCEIDKWLDDNVDFLDRSKFNYIILDDDSDMLYHQRNHFFLVDGYCGLTPNVVYRAKRFLTEGK
jgi:hypothetical protein